MTRVEDPIAAVLARALVPRRAATIRGLPVADMGLAAAILVAQTLLAVGMPASDGRTPDLAGWALLTASALVLVFRRRAPWCTTVVVIFLVGPYHALDYAHTAAVPAGLFALLSLAIAGPPLRTFLTLGVALGIMTTVMLSVGAAHDVPEMLRGSGWLVAFVLIGEAVRIHRNYVVAIVERAERAERTREEEAARRVAEERLRIARDLHDLLAHSITLIGVQTSVAAHVLVADPERLDRDAVAKALDGIADTCRDARAELRTTLEVLRANDPNEPGGAKGPQVNGSGPLPGLSGVPDLVRAAEGAGATVELSVRTGAEGADGADGADGTEDGGGAGTGMLPPAVGAAAYRIVQEALTNAVRHAGPAVRVRVTIERAPRCGALRVIVRDDGGAAPAASATAAPPHPAEEARPQAAGAALPADGSETPDGPSGGTSGDRTDRCLSAGFGIAGMRERARSVGGTLEAEPRADGPGFTVAALLPVAPARAPARRVPAPSASG